MAGVTDVSFRRLLKRRGGVGLSVSEFISVEGLTRSNPKSKRQMRFYPDERPFAVQIFGGQPERMRMAAEMAEEVGADSVLMRLPRTKVLSRWRLRLLKYTRGLRRFDELTRRLPWTYDQDSRRFLRPYNYAVEGRQRLRAAA